MDLNFESLLRHAIKFHGHLCSGQVIGVKMAMVALGKLGIQDPGGDQGLDLVILTETDRCPLDAMISVSTRTPGKRSVKMFDYGKTAATFYNAGTGQAIRVCLNTQAMHMAEKSAQSLVPPRGEKEALIAALIAMPEDELVTAREVTVHLDPSDLPGEARHTVVCQSCGEIVRDKREVMRDGRILCKPCAQGTAYYA